MKVAVLQAHRVPLAFEERPVPEPGPGQIRIKVAACGVCHTDYHLWEGLLAAMTRLPVVPGHEVAGVVDQLGPGVTRWAPGDRVGMPWIYSTCGHCDACVSGDDPGCPHQLATGVQVDGGYQPYMIAPAESATRIPDGLELVEAAPLFCAGLTVYGGLEAARVRPGSTVAVQGLGGLGHLGVLVAKALGAEVIAVTRGEEKAALARQLGAVAAIDAAAADPGEQLAAWGGADIILTTVPSARAIMPLMKGLANRGTLVIVGATPEPLTVTPIDLVVRRTRLMGSAVGTRRQMRDLLALALRAQIRPLVERCRLEDAPRIFERLAAGQLRGRAVIEF